MADLKLPAKKELVGILLSAETIETKSGEIVLVSIQDTDDEIVTISSWKIISC